MIELEIKELLFKKFRFLQDGINPLLEKELTSEAIVAHIPAKSSMFEEMAHAKYFPMVIDGIIKVSKLSEKGRELQLYLVESGESCLVTASCMMSSSVYPVRGETATEVTAVLFPQTLFEKLISEHIPFRKYVFSLFSERFSILMALVEEVAFKKLDERLAMILIKRGPLLKTTHQELADELGSVREIVSRVLKSFQDKGWVVLGREQIQVISQENLRQIGVT